MILTLILSFCLLFSHNSGKSSLEYELEILELKNTILKLEKELLENKINKKDDKKTTNKRKFHNPFYKHQIKVGNSVVIGNPNASVTITQFFDFQ